VVADELDMTPVAVNSALQRARARLDQVGVLEDQVEEGADPSPRELVDRYVTAFENADIAALKRLLAKDVILEMPPFTNWYVGRDGYGRFIARVYATRGTDWRMIPTGANGQPAFAAYLRHEDGAYHLHTLQVFTVSGDQIVRTTVFQEEGVFALFGLSPTLPG
jgi:RNA polymerase sigma-70 factor (ECF subfamily)